MNPEDFQELPRFRVFGLQGLNGGFTACRVEGGVPLGSRVLGFLWGYGVRVDDGRRLLPGLEFVSFMVKVLV